MKRTLVFVILFALFLAGCGGKSEDVTAPAVVPDDAGQATEEAVTEPAEDVVAPPVVAGLPMEPQEITFQAADGQALSGWYYPAAVNPAPLLVIMHWVGGNMTDWYEVAPWLQNRGLVNPFMPNPGTEPWWDPTWFPELPDDHSVGVFIFSFRDCLTFPQGGCPGWDPEGYLLDAQAAMLKATELEGVDTTRIVTMGSSIGADGAIDGCVFLNEQMPGSCQGALSLSPGGYLGIPYADAVKSLGGNDPQVAAWCLGDEGDFDVCESATNEGNAAYQMFEIANGGHGNFLISPDLEPLPMDLIQDFLAETVDW